MVKQTKHKAKKATKKKQRASIRAKAQAAAAKLATQKEVTDPKSKVPPTLTNLTETNDEAPFPTENNGNSHESTYLALASRSAKKAVTEKSKTTPFHIVRNLLHHTTASLDDSTLVPNKSENVRLLVMCAVPAKDIEEEEAPLEAIRKMNCMIKSLINKVPSTKLGLWNPDANSENLFLKELPEDVEVVEKYVYDYSRFLSPGRNLYCCINLYYNPGKHLCPRLKM